MPKILPMPILSDLVHEGFAYGGNYLVEFDADSFWYETSLTIAAHGLKHGLKTEFHTFMHTPAQIRERLSGFGLDLKLLEEKRQFRIMDTYTGLTGLPLQGESPLQAAGGTGELNNPSFLSKLTAHIVKLLQEGVPDEAKGWLHIDDNTSIFNRYFPEAEIVNIYQTRIFPYMKLTETTTLHAHLAGAASQSFLKQFESQCDGIIDFKSLEEHGRIERYVRARSIRGKVCDSRWRRLQLSENGEALLDHTPVKEGQMGIRGWVKGPKN